MTNPGFVNVLALFTLMSVINQSGQKRVNVDSAAPDKRMGAASQRFPGVAAPNARANSAVKPWPARGLYLPLVALS
jgi:hypothetical protein